MRILIRGTALLGLAAMLAAAPAAAQDRVTAGGGAFVAEALAGCDSDLARLNQMFGWQVSWPRDWEALASASNDDVRAAIALWRTAPAALAADQAALAESDSHRLRAPRVVVERVAGQVEQLEARLAAGPPTLAQTVAPPLRVEWARLFSDEIRPALAAYRAFLRTRYQPSEAAGLGDAQCFRNAVQRFTSLDIAPEEIEAIGRRLLDETETQLAALHRVPRAEMPRLLARLRAGAGEGFTADQLVETSRAAIARAEAAMPRMFSGPALAPVVVEPMAADMEGSFPAGFYTGGAEGRPAAYVVNRSRPAERRLMAEVIAFHEALPGHHLRAARGFPAGEFNSGFLEGWAIYAEYLADEMGLYSGPDDRAGMMAKHLWAASRLVVEPGLHLHGWTRAQAVDFMRTHTALSDAEIALEVDRYIAIPGQSLSYMLGYDRLAAARLYAETRLGARFDLRRFHDVVWAGGSRPLDQVHADVVHWADAGSVPS